MTSTPPVAPPTLPPMVPPDDPVDPSGGGGGGERRLVATYHDRDAARRAIEALSMRGVDGGRIHVVDVDPEAIAGPVPDADRRTDARVGSLLERGLLQGCAWGFVVGFGTAGTGMLLWLGPVVTTLMVALGGASAGMMVGASIGLLRLPVMAEAWGETSRPLHPGGTTVVVVRLRAGQDAAPIRQVLAREGADVTEIDG